MLWISWKPRGSAERKVPCSSYHNTACNATSGLAVSVMGALILAELCKDARFPERVLNCGTLRAIFWPQLCFRDKEDSQAQELHIVFWLVVSIRHPPLPRKLRSQATFN